MTPTNEDILATAKIICAAMTGPSDFGWYDQSDQYRAKCMDAARCVLVAERQAIRADRLEAQEALLREAMEALENRDGGRHDDDCKVSRFINGICNCGHDEARATLAKLRDHRGETE